MQMSAARVLLLNRNYAPLKTITPERAIKQVFTENAVIVLPPSDESKNWMEMTWEDWSKLIPKDGDNTISSPTQVFRIPEIVRLAEFDKVPHRQVKLSRRAIYRRDSYTCQYCGSQPGSEDLSIDHVWPKSLGGITEWDNVVVACVSCNRRKSNRPLKTDPRAKKYRNVCNLKLKNKPKMPQYDPLQGCTDIHFDSWQHFISDAYWNARLQD